MGGGLGGRGLLGGNGTEGKKEFFFNCVVISQEGANYALDTLDARIFKRRAGIRLHGVLIIGAIQYGGMLVWRELGILGKRVVVTSEDLGNVSFHVNMSSLFGLVPFEVHAC